MSSITINPSTFKFSYLSPEETNDILSKFDLNVTKDYVKIMFFDELCSLSYLKNSKLGKVYCDDCGFTQVYNQVENDEKIVENQGELKIENDKLTLSLEWKKELILIEYKYIRGYLIEKNFLDLGANFFIYKINELNPSMTFQVVSVS
jgi:hypothetical protein